MPTAEGCFFEHLGGCDGRLQRAHLIPKSRIRREFRGELTEEQLLEIVWHPTCWRWMCEHHHADFDNKRIDLPRHEVPDDVEDYAAIWDLGWSLDNDYGKLD